MLSLKTHHHRFSPPPLPRDCPTRNMLVHPILLAGLAAFVQAAPLPDSSNALLQSLNLPIDEVGATAFSLLYGTPLVGFRQLASTSGILELDGTNVLASHDTAANASVHVVVRPNVDTIYSTGVFDLSATDLVVTVPPMEEDRFYLFAFYDPSVQHSKEQSA